MSSNTRCNANTCPRQHLCIGCHLSIKDEKKKKEQFSCWRKSALFGKIYILYILYMRGKHNLQENLLPSDLFALRRQYTLHFKQEHYIKYNYSYGFQFI